MGTEKRERQKQARQQKIEALRHVEKRESARRKGVMVGVAIVAFLAFAIGFSVLTADDDEATTATDDTSTPDEDSEGDESDEPADEGAEGDEGDDPPAASEPEESAEPVPCPEPDGSSERRTAFPAPPPTCVDEGVDYTATMVTDAGTIEIDLFEDQAPVTVNNFVYLARYQFFDGLTFHRVIPDFVLQGGDPNGDGTGGPGYQFDDELPDPEEYQAGSLAMANSGPETNGSQFFIVTSEQGADSLVQAVGGEAAYSLFGQVTEGMDVVAAIEADGTTGGEPSTVHTIESVTISES